MTYNSLSRFDTSVVDRGALSFLGRLMAGREDSTECLFEDLIGDLLMWWCLERDDLWSL